VEGSIGWMAVRIQVERDEKERMRMTCGEDIKQE
jgi:hypothetical protein